MHSSSVFLAVLTISQCWIPTIFAQTPSPSNGSNELPAFAKSPRWNLFINYGYYEPGNFGNWMELNISVASLGPWATRWTRQSFLQSGETQGNMLSVSSLVYAPIESNSFVCMSCDEADYPPEDYINPTTVLKSVLDNGHLTWLVLYSRTSNHCTISDIDSLPSIVGVMTTDGTTAGTNLSDWLRHRAPTLAATIYPNVYSFTVTNSSSGPISYAIPGSNSNPSMGKIVLYACVGLAGALIIAAILVGVIRQRRHPERYGPNLIVGESPQGFARGIARAMLESLPVVKFSELDRASRSSQKDPNEDDDFELDDAASRRSSSHRHYIVTIPADHRSGSQSSTQTTTATRLPPTNTTTTTTLSSTTTSARPPPSSSSNQPQASSSIPVIASSSSAAVPTTTSSHRPHTTSDTSTCSICTEDFSPSDPIRILPCRHKFHPPCVDPWLLREGTCPLCRVDLRVDAETQKPDQPLPESSNARAEGSGAVDVDGVVSVATVSMRGGGGGGAPSTPSASASSSTPAAAPANPRYEIEERTYYFASRAPITVRVRVDRNNPSGR